MSILILAVSDGAPADDALVSRLRAEGFTAETVGPGGSAFRSLGAGPWDVLLLAGADGLPLLRRLRGLGMRVPVLLLTPRDDAADRVRALEDGADDCLSRPFVFEELVARLRALARRRQFRGGVVASHGVRVDRGTGRAERAGHPLRLRPKERELMLFFLSHPGQVLARERIFSAVWGEPYDKLSNTLDVHVNGLRRKLERHGPRLIHASHGRGYLFGDAPPRRAARSGEG
jgi:DNA-binding response OmpR family regulator